MAKRETGGGDGLGLGRMGGISLSALLTPAEEKFREIDLDLIREDGDNPRRDFDADTLAELAATIRARGVLTPISVRPDPDRAGGFIVNHGHRRLRASKLAGRATIPAVLDGTFKDEDRIIENIQRDNLGMFEVARFIEAKLAAGMKQKEVATLIGKSTAYVSNHAQLSHLPPLTEQAVAEGRVADVSAVVELAKAEKRDPEAAAALLAEEGQVGRGALLSLKKSSPGGEAEPATENRDQEAAAPSANTGKKTRSVAAAAFSPPARTASFGIEPADFAPKPSFGSGAATADDDEGWRRGRVVVARRGTQAVMLLERRPSRENRVWLRSEDGEEFEAGLKELKLLAVVAE